ncbi:MAG: right-handed parallel beta-helix repeat-containing protein, partial [Candidatus Cloacimonadota bacterium]|nr:right-handed parallel beta-helix repeat-containing protein [Candidatus Cloacimonadota bacterium]
NLSNIYLNKNFSSDNHSDDIYGTPSEILNVILDTFTVLVPTAAQVYLLENFTFDIQHGLVDSVQEDLYVSPNGSNSNSGLSALEPLLSLSLALEMISPDSLNPLTIHLADGIYSPSATNEIFPLEAKGHLSIIGNSQASTTLNAEALSSIIYCFSIQNFSLQNLTLKNAYNSLWNRAGGLFCVGATGINISNVSFINNHSQYYGGGMQIRSSSDINIANCIFENNSAKQGGGIYLRESPVTFSNVSVFNNTSSGKGGGIYFYECNPDFDPHNRCNIFYNHSLESSEGNDLASDQSNVIQIVVDTFSVLEPDGYYANPISYFNFDIQNAKIEPVSADLYVNPEGSNNNTGLTSTEPLQTIGFALQKILAGENDPHSIFLANGVYSPSQTGEIFPIRCKNYVSIIGENKNLTVLDAEETARGMICAVDEVVLQNFTITNGNSGYSDNGGGLYCSWCNPTLDNLKIINNETDEDGGGIYLDHSDAIFLEVTVCHNLAQENGGGIYFKASEPTFDEYSLSDIYYNEISSHEYFGKDLFVYGNDIVNVFVDTFTVLFANQDYVYPRTQFYVDVEHSKIKQLDQDIYVNPSGSNGNSGLSPADPFQNISYAMERVVSNDLNPHTIHLAPGIYSHDITGEDFPLYAKANINLQGASSENTILDGSNLSRLIYCESVNNFRIQQMTIQNGNSGSGYSSHGGGLYFSNCDPILNNLKIFSNSTNNTSNFGGGIFLNNSDATLQEVTICQNSSLAHGGGLYLNNSDPIFDGVIVRQNTAHYNGGGMYLENSNPTFKATTVCQNYSYADGGGIFFNNSTPIFDQEDLSNIYCNDISSWDYFAKDLYNYNSGIIDVFVDTFTVLYPDNYHLYPPDQFNMDIQNGKIEQIDQDIYISPSGSNSNSGISPDEPFQNISFAMDRIISNESNPHTIHLATGTYSQNTTGEDFPIYGKSHINFKGESAETTILDGADLSRLIYCNSVDNIKIQQMTIQNGNCGIAYNSYGGGIRMQGSSWTSVYDDSIFVEDVNVINNHSYKGGGIYNEYINLSLNQVKMNNNTGYKGGGLYCSGSSYADTICVMIDKCEICNNIADNTASGFSGNGGKIHISNTTIAGNIPGSYSNCAVEFSSSDVVFVNTICWNDSLSQIKLMWNSELTVSHSDIKDGEENIEDPYGNATINWLEGNIDSIPQFSNLTQEDFSLQEDSPCIDAGIPYFEWQGNVIVDMTPEEYEGIAPDMGAWEYGMQEIDNPASIPLVFGMKQNFPNPFSASTNISFSLPVISEVNIAIYNIRGQKVKSVSDETYQAGRFSVNWDGTNEMKKRVGSGIYFYKMEAKSQNENFHKIRKMIYIR